MNMSMSRTPLLRAMGVVKPSPGEAQRSGRFFHSNIAIVRFPGPNQGEFGDRYSLIAWVKYRKENLHQLPG